MAILAVPDGFPLASRVAMVRLMKSWSVLVTMTLATVLALVLAVRGCGLDLVAWLDAVDALGSAVRHRDRGGAGEAVGLFGAAEAAPTVAETR